MEARLSTRRSYRGAVGAVLALSVMLWRGFANKVGGVAEVGKGWRTPVGYSVGPGEVPSTGNRGLRYD